MRVALCIFAMGLTAPWQCVVHAYTSKTVIMGHSYVSTFICLCLTDGSNVKPYSTLI